nr:hypothetical protein [uncultured Pseudomonas sp.]
MTITPLAVITTNTTPNSQVTIEYGCEYLWATGQGRALKLLTVQKTCPIRGPQTVLVRDFSARAARIAAAYARFYLELEEGCNPELKGRFYWMGLAAFASKQVMCGLDFVKKSNRFMIRRGKYEALTAVPKEALHIGKDSLGKGNFWLFQDIYVWHWFYANYPEMFAKCSEERDASRYPAKALNNIKEMPWAEESLSIMGNFSINEYLREGFDKIAKCEASAPGDRKRSLQLASLMDIADHEQRKVLQPLIYNDISFQGVLSAQQAMEFVPGLPKRLAAFSTACDVDDEELKIQMKEGDLYVENDRMEFIKEIAGFYHRLMADKADYMEGEILAISHWNAAT